MAPPQGKGAYLAAQEGTATPAPKVTPVRAAKTRDTVTPPATTQPPVTPKTKNPDLGTQTPPENAVPALVNWGIHKDIGTVNNEVQQIVDAHQKQLGYKPSAGLVFDLLRASSIIGPNPNYDALFGHVPKSQRDAFVNSVSRQSGVVQPEVTEPSVQQLMKKYPTVQAGLIPASWAGDFLHALSVISSVPDNLNVTSQGMTFDQARKVEEQATGSVVQGYEQAFRQRQAVRTVIQGQTELNKMMGTKLPVTGFMNQDWMKAVSNWMKTKDYFQRTAQYQADQAGFKSYGSYLKAFKAKTDAVHKHGLLADFLNALPVNAFAHGTNPLNVAASLVTGPFANPSLGASYPLHAISRTASTTFRTVGGAVQQGKADAAAGNAFMNAAIDGGGVYGHPKTLEKAKAAAKAQLEKNPTWIRAFFPGLADNLDKTKLGNALDQAVNLTGDIVLLRKPAFTGERVAPGAIDLARNSTYVRQTSRYAYAYLQEGKIGRAAAVLEGGPGAERLVSATAQSVRRGWMTPEQFQEHVADLFSHGKTTVSIQKPTPESVVDVFHGTDVTAPLTPKNDSGLFGNVTYVTESPGYASTYAEARAVQKSVGPNVRTNAEHLGEGSTPNVRLHRFDTKNLFPYLGKERTGEVADAPKLIKKVLKKLTPEEQVVAKNLETMKLEQVTNPSTLYEYLRTIGARMEAANRPEFAAEAKAAGEKAIPETGTYGADFANEVLQRAGFRGIQVNPKEIVVFNPEKHLLPRFEKPVEVPVEGSLLPSLRTAHLPTPSGVTVDAREQVRNALDSFDRGARQNGQLGTLAADMVSFLRTEFGHHIPEGARAAYDPKLPERVHDFVLKHFNDAELANKFESQVVRARATGNTPKLEKLANQLQRLYYKKNEIGPGSVIEDDPFSPLLESEAGSRLFFPAGNLRNATNPFDVAAVTAQRINRQLNRVGGHLRRILILSPSLAWKHAVGDTLRRFVGGDAIIDPAAKSSLREINSMIDGDPQLARRWGTFLDRVTNGEAYYMTTPGEKTVTFSTGKYFRNPAYMEAAGAHLRVMLDDKAYTAFLKSSPDDLSPLVELIAGNRVYRRLWSAKQKEETIRKYGKEAWEQKVRIISATHGITEGRAEMMQTAFPAGDYAAQIYNRYQRVAEAARAQGTSIEEARDVLRENRGAHADKALGDWVKDNGVDFQVEKGLVTGGGSTWGWDQVSSKLIQTIMTANKANRNGMARNIAAHQYRSLVDAGWDKGTALETAMHVAEKQTIYHMLDFANRLQIEQDFRWLSYFATKHRLYWKWVASTFARNPAAAAAIGDVKQHLDDKGNLNFTLFGHGITVPAARLLWVNGKEYPEESPLAMGLFEGAKNGLSAQAFANGLVGTLGSGFQRNAVPAIMIIRAVRMETGGLPATYTAATSGLDETNKRYFNRAVNNFQMDYFAEHGHYAPEQDAVKYALFHLAGQNAWRSNLPLPAYFSSQSNDTQKLLDQYMAIPDPQKRSKFLDGHPELAAQFGLSQTPSDYTHYRTFWSQYTQALDLYHAERDKLFHEAQLFGRYTPGMDQKRKEISAAFEKIFTKLKEQDLAKTPVERRREVNGEVLGLWGQQVSADPLVDPAKTLKDLFPNLNSKALQKSLPSNMIKQARTELNLLNDPEWVAKTFQDPSEARTRKRELLQFIEDFQPFAHDALGSLQQKYLEQHVNPYWKQVEAFNAQIAKMGRGAKDVAYARLRSWKDQQSEPVKVDGITFPPPIVMAWATLPPDMRRQRLAALATGSWSNLADYEKQLLGVKTAEFTSYGWEKLLEVRKQYAHDNPGKSLDKNQTIAVVNQIDKSIPGFKADWQLSQKPKIDIFEKTIAYTDMSPHVKEWWDTIVGANAHKLASVYYDSNTASDVRAKIPTIWEDAVQKQILPALNSDPQVKKWLAPYLTANPDFLNTIIKHG